MSDLSVPSDKIEEIKEEMQKEFDNIINEVRMCNYAYTYTCVYIWNQIYLTNCFGVNEWLPCVFKAQQELETEGLKGEFDRTQATQTLETTLDKLLDHLEEKNIQEPEQQMEGVERASDPARGSRNLAPKQPGSSTSFPGCVLTPVCSVSTSVILTPHVLTVNVSEKPEKDKYHF